jgi:hypothetical protein
MDEIGDDPGYLSYLKKIPKGKGVTGLEYITGITKDENRVVHRHIGINQFEKKTTKVTKGFYKQQKNA